MVDRVDDRGDIVMSKYYKAEDVIRAIAEQLCWIARTEYGDKFTTEDWVEEAEDYVSDLPTIEVSEEMEFMVGQMAKDCFDKMSEDCISRAYAIEVLSHIKEDEQWRTECIDNEIRLIKLLPSVTTEQSSMVENENKCDTCCQYKIGFEDGKLEMIRMIEDALKGKSE